MVYLKVVAVVFICIDVDRKDKCNSIIIIITKSFRNTILQYIKLLTLHILLFPESSTQIYLYLILCHKQVAVLYKPGRPNCLKTSVIPTTTNVSS